MRASGVPASGRVHRFRTGCRGHRRRRRERARRRAVTVIASRSDARGRFEMALPAGRLRPARHTRRVTSRPTASRCACRAASHSNESSPCFARVKPTQRRRPPDSHAHTDLAWQLRHLPRSVLRDGAAQAEWTESDAAAVPGQPAASLFGRAVDSSDALASRLADTDFTGQLNLVTTASANPVARLRRARCREALPTSCWARRLAPSETGAFAARLARAPSRPGTCWVNTKRIGREAHALRFGMSYSAHGPRDARHSDDCVAVDARGPQCGRRVRARSLAPAVGSRSRVRGSRRPLRLSFGSRTC